MHDHHVCAVQGLIELRSAVILLHVDAGEKPLRLFERLCAAIAKSVHAAPSIRGLTNLHLMAELAEFARDSTQEVRVAIVPAGGERMAEEHDSHACTSMTRACAVEAEDVESCR